MWGNGAATTHIFAQQGSMIFGCDLNLDSAKYTKQKVKSLVQGAEMEVVTTDVRKNEQCKELVDACMKQHGRIDVLVK